VKFAIADNNAYLWSRIVTADKAFWVTKWRMKQGGGMRVADQTIIFLIQL
jgi:hypothetical protein